MDHGAISGCDTIDDDEDNEEGGPGKDLLRLIPMTVTMSQCADKSSSDDSSGESSISSNSSTVPLANPGGSSLEERRPLEKEGGMQEESAVARQQREAHIGLPVWSDSAQTSAVIKHKPQSNDMFIICDRHVGCSRTRTCNRSRRGCRGRPMGELAAWYILGGACTDKATHQKATTTRQQRKDAREALEAARIMRAICTAGASQGRRRTLGILGPDGTGKFKRLLAACPEERKGGAFFFFTFLLTIGVFLAYCCSFFLQ